ncbi:cartilage intermediate layer protein 2-like isoform X2 [Syngnathus typhle]|uniref:cartilage intermediate layer protein 2-like isoform X2 n=1 Tax=Syngnathus typhle TaxID=161592 RepID=UPI002A69A000|nr:cartilage intermediate layer protein 2-like isoform X2 [Syngnathus typhle]XP_061138010.1 cartilage intermediate layer protein 2-like isoform X2 [Syngnathus typhle]
MTHPMMIKWLGLTLVLLHAGVHVHGSNDVVDPECWTPWFNRDDASGTGDYETLSDLQKENPGKICEHPIQIEVTTTSGDSVDSTGDVIQVSDTNTGFICENANQTHNGSCADYKIRFMCPLEFCGPEVCKTPWYNQDYSGESGDYEMLDMISAANPGEICDLPLGIEVQTVDGKPYTSTGETIAVMDTETGFICKNDDQKDGGCSDYKVRFICPLDFCKTKE